jgi:hypothetical protein
VPRLPLFCKKQFPLGVARPPQCGGKEKARDSVRDDAWSCISSIGPPFRDIYP